MTITTAKLKTPGVYIDELSLLPPSIVQVSTAIPVFLGYTEKGDTNEPTRIASLKEYEDVFGRGYQYKYVIDSVANLITVANDGANSPIDFAEFGTFFFYESIRMYFLNGGGPCYIISVGLHPTLATSTYLDKDDFTTGLNLIDKMDEPTIIAFPEATNLSAQNYGEIATAALVMAEKLQDKFVLIDSAKGEDLSKTNTQTYFRGQIAPNPIQALSYGAAYYPHLITSLFYTLNQTTTYDGSTLTSLAGSANYAAALESIRSLTIAELPPSSLIAGVYAQNDHKHGVWKAPANIALQGVVKPAQAISHQDQENMNIDADTGKSINAIRSFSGKGNIIWGARTLDGNSNEWRYIQVRRLFMTVEESTKKAIQPFVFENNNGKTWVKVNAMISSYLNELWKDGALMGSKPEEAYFVQVGLGTTMTEEDIQKGRMNVRIGLAAVRPAEFIVLSFSHLIDQ